jgi:hypothetical protein
MMRLAIYATDNNRRAMHIAMAMHCGARRCGLQSDILTRFTGVAADLAVAYGWTHESVFRSYLAAGAHYVYWDLGYWNRRPSHNSAEGHHRLAVDDWDTAKTMARGCPTDRLEASRLKIVEQRDGQGEVILLAGMSAKAAGTHGYRFEQWELRKMKSLRETLPHWSLVYRPKPTKARPATETIEVALRRSRVLVTHHSNAAVEALMFDIPIFAIKGVGHLVSDQVLGTSRPYAERRQLLADVAYAQWTPQEMRTGQAWEHIRGLL